MAFCLGSLAILEPGQLNAEVPAAGKTPATYGAGTQETVTCYLRLEASPEVCFMPLFLWADHKVYLES